MKLTKSILIIFSIGVVVAEGCYSTFNAGLRVLDSVLALVVLYATLKLTINFKRNYGLIAICGGGLSISYFVQMTSGMEFFPSGYLWMAAMTIGLICLIKFLQNL